MEGRYKSKIVVDLLLKRKNENGKEEILNVENDVFYSYDEKISKATKKRENPSKNTKTTIEQN